jgi:hypothetical protein
VREFIESDEQLRGGQPFILIGHSQGTLVSRALLEEWDNHPVHMFLSLAGPHLGQFGLFADLISNPFLRGLATEAAWTVLYTQVKRIRTIRDSHLCISFCNIWSVGSRQLQRIELLARSPSSP